MGDPWKTNLAETRVEIVFIPSMVEANSDARCDEKAHWLHVSVPPSTDKAAIIGPFVVCEVQFAGQYVE